MRRWIKNILETIKNERTVQIFLMILLIGAALRYYGLSNAENTDEYNEVIEALRVASGKFNLNRWHKKGYQNILAIEYGIYFVIGYVTGIFNNPMDFAAKIVRNMEPLFLIGRYTTATMGTLSIGLIYVIGRKIYNNRVALIAAALFAVNTIHVLTSHLVGTDVPLTFFFLLSFYFIIRFYHSKKMIDYITAAFLGAVTINIKLTGIGIGIIFILAYLFQCKNEGRRIVHYIYAKEVLYSSVAFILGFIISNPPIILGLKKFVLYHYGIYTNVSDEVPYAIGGNAYYTYILLLYKEFELPLFLLSVVSLIYALYKREEWDYILVSFIIGLFLVLANTDFLVQNRYLMTMFPAIFLLSGRFLDSIFNKFFISEKKRAAILVIICALILAFPLINSIKYVRTLTKDNTSIASKKWIEENIPANSKILMDAGRTIITSGPRLNQSREKLEEKLNIIRNLKDGETYDSAIVKIVDSYASIYFELLLKNMPEITYDITTTELGTKVETAEYYKNNGFDYFIHDKNLDFRITDPLWREKFPKSAEFYDSIDKEFKLIITFSPSSKRSGSTIKIYTIK